MIEIRIDTLIDANNKITCRNNFNIQHPFSIYEGERCLRELEVCSGMVKAVIDKCQELNAKEKTNE